MNNQYFFTPSHEWIKLDHDDIFYVGISDYAQKSLGDIVYVECPILNKTLTAGSIFATIESVKSVSDIYVPIAGEIIEINHQVIAHPELINSSPFVDAWLIKLKITNAADITQLLSYDKYNAQYLG